MIPPAPQADAAAPASPSDPQKKVLVWGTLGLLLLGAVLTNVPWPAFSSDLAKGKLWRTSSTFAVCQPRIRSCSNTKTAIFFHTNEEESPWIEIDLEEPRQFSSMVITNRSDCCSERARPLAVEVKEGDRWRIVARTVDDFSVWKPEFAPQTSRYVRLRVLRKSAFHLEGIEVHP